VRLLIGLVALSAVGLLITAAVGNNLLRSYLVKQTDQRLVQATSVPLRLGDAGPEPFGGGPAPLPNSVVYEVYTTDGTLVQSQGAAFGGLKPPSFAGTTLQHTLARGSKPFTVQTRSGAWRVVLRPAFDRAGTQYTLAASSSLGDVDKTVARMTNIELLVGVGVLVVLALLGAVVVRLSLRPLTAIEETAEAIAAGDLSRRIPDASEHTEVGRLSSALNAMLTRIEAAVRAREASEREARSSEDRMRQFVADAGHELRTPLTSIRGFAELHRQRPEESAAESTRLFGRIETEATRMGGLVDDLLLLARLDARRPLDSAPVDLLPIVADAAFDAHTLAPERAVGLDLPGGHPIPGGDEDETDHDPVVVVGDEAGIRQVLANFVSNALAHTPEGTPVRIGLRIQPEDDERWAVMEVTDQGPGLSPEQASRVFERFYRIDAARSRADGGSGLGLSIAAALAEAMGGRVEVTSAPQAGSTFRVLLPMAA
jgi:two-component system OmpR family sensor kinase